MESGLLRQVVFHHRFKCTKMLSHVTAKEISHRRPDSHRSGLLLQVSLYLKSLGSFGFFSSTITCQPLDIIPIVVSRISLPLL